LFRGCPREAIPNFVSAHLHPSYNYLNSDPSNECIFPELGHVKSNESKLAGPGQWQAVLHTISRNTSQTLKGGSLIDRSAAGRCPNRIIDIQHVVYTNESCQLWYSVRLARQLDVLHDANKLSMATICGGATDVAARTEVLQELPFNCS
jgi:hypothetical protein